MNVLHIASHEINIGDGALNSVIKSYLKGHAVEDLDVHGSEKYLWEPEYRNRFDKVIIGGGGALNAGGETHDLPMAFRVRPDTLNAKMAFVALGYNNFYRQEYKPVQVRNLRAILNRCEILGIPFSVRDDGSAEAVEAVTGIHVEAVPDPGLFVQVDETYEPMCIEKGRMNVVIQLAGDNLSFRFQEQAVFDTFIVKLVKFSKVLVDRYDANIILAPHIMRDLDITARFWNVYENVMGTMGRKNLRQTAIAGPSSYARYFKVYKDADLVLGMRGHSVICGVGLGTPTIAIDTHPKVRGFMKKAGLEDWVMKPQDFRVEKAIDYVGREFSPAIDGAKTVLDGFMEKVIGTC